MKRFFSIILFIGVAANTQAQNVGIGTTTPTLAGLVVDRNVGAVNAMFGSNGIGVAIEGNFPGIGFNSYYNNSRKAINTGYGSWIGLNPATGLLTIATSPTSITGQGTAMPLVDRLNIKPNGHIGVQGNTDPQSPLSFANTLGEKVNFFHVNSTANYGIGIQGSQMQLYAGGEGDAISFGYGNSNAFTENMRVNGNGNVGIGGTAPYKLTVTKTGDGIYQQDATGAAAIGFFVSPSFAYLQTKTNTPLAFATNDAAAQMLLGTNGNLKIGNGTAATEKLEVAGSIKIVDGTQGANKVLTSDANGKGSWKGSGMSSAFRASFPTTTMFNGGETLLPYNTSGSSNFDDGGNWSNANNRYTAVETGVYHFDAIVSFGSFIQTTSAGATLVLEMHKNNSSDSEAQTVFSTGAGGAFFLTVNLSWTLKLNAGEFVNFQIYQASGQARPATGILSGYRVY